MIFDDFLKLIKRNVWLIISFTTISVISTIYFTRNIEKEYESSMLIYTGIASANSMPSETFQQRMDEKAIAMAFDNVITIALSKATLEEVSLRLFSFHLTLNNYDPAFINEKNFLKAHEIIPDSVKKVVLVPNSPDDTYERLVAYKNATQINWVKNLLDSKGLLYGLPFLTKHLSVARKDISDMLLINYIGNDPGICKQTLELLAAIFIRRYKSVREGETQKVVAYFEDEKDESQSKLKESEEKLKEFGMKNKIINYYEQTKIIADAQQTLLDNIQREKMNVAGTTKTVATLEVKLKNVSGLLKANGELASLRNELAVVNSKIGQNELGEGESSTADNLKKRSEILKKQIKEKLNDLLNRTYTKDNLPREELVEQWLSNVLELEQSKAKLEVLEGQLKNMDKVYTKYAPLGSTLKSLEREAEVYEQEYMENLKSFNQSKLRQQNLELSGNLKLIDAPQYPVEPKSSKRIPLTAGSFLLGLILIIGFLVLKELTSPAIDSATKVTSFTGLSANSLFPINLFDKLKPKQEILVPAIWVRLTNSILSRINPTNNIPVQKECKTIVLLPIGNSLDQLWVDNLIKQFVLQDFTINRLQIDQTIKLQGAQHILSPTLRDFKDLAIQQGLSTDADFLIVEMPEAGKNVYPIIALQNSDVILILLDAQKKWTNAHKNLVTSITSICPQEPLVAVLNVGWDQVLDQIPT